MCNNNSVDWRYIAPEQIWLRWEIDDEKSQRLSREFSDKGSDPFELGSIVAAGRYGVLPGAAVYAIGMLIERWGDDLSYYNEGCGVQVTQLVRTPPRGVFIPTYTMQSQ